GSQITNAAPFAEALAKVTELARSLQSSGFALQRIDFGGGLGIRYETETPLSISDYAKLVMKYIRRLDLQLFLEPGRSLAASAGALVSEVQFIKHTEGKNFA